jgi:hypothetical protein
LRLANDESLRALAPPSGTISGGEYAVKRSEGAIWFSDASGANAARMTIAFGSGKTGMTYAGQFGPDRMIEYGMSYLPRIRKWYVTPGQEGRFDASLGLEHRASEARRCVLCHAVTAPAGRIEPEPRFFGVGCESCHGAGGDHIERAKANAPDLKMEDLSRRDGIGINLLCGRCHRDLDDVPMVSREVASTQRYQPYGLSLSPCFRKSNGRLTCLTCHSAHSDADTNPRHYEAACLGCHSPRDHGATACPVNPVEKCIDCHMPKRKIFPGGDVPVKMADHLIWAYRPGRPKPL